MTRGVQYTWLDVAALVAFAAALPILILWAAVDRIVFPSRWGR